VNSSDQPGLTALTEQPGSSIAPEERDVVAPAAARTSGELTEIARRLRIRVLHMIVAAKSSHIGTAYSAIELLVALYFRVLRIDPARPRADDRDRFILSKGHAAAALYATLMERGFFSEALLAGYYQDGGVLPGHADVHGVPGVEVAAGSLGHGLAIAAGMALAAQRDASDRRVFALLSDGECDEGSIWEAALFAAARGLDNLVAIVDYNKLQGMGFVSDVIGLEPLAAKWEAFGWGVREIDGHDLPQIEATLRDAPFTPGKPSMIIAHTVKGKGVSFMENALLWHYRTPDADEYRAALAELESRG